MALTLVEHDRPKPVFDAVGILLAFLMTAVVFLRVYKHWQILTQNNKLSAVFLLISLVITPVVTIWREKTGRKVQHQMFLVLAYIWLLLSLGVCNP